ncbi:helix-turn-helix domain-containing protein [Mycolicibacillus koreensis]|uniref:Uncharacterized protein n=1 Tax=Mycolicibacillus koreensis TaxID=1069220 RepID=A0A7I7SJQ3_9MYCO|nr:helix-turn-helix transcriptional regulator [Mycolicibacillus koreensis]OSC27596.1 hypothetical protein B8W67_18035 [Mycolicibacillus koreensis]BBY56691.1 hypothetical protein MKOR_39420 [Mycolicibacillus koreensis]
MKITDKPTPPVDVRRVIGANVRRIRTRHGISLETFAREAKRYGLNYSTGRVSDLEGGRVEAKVDTVLALTQVLANLADQPVALADLFEGDQRAGLFRGQAVEPDGQTNVGPLDIARRLGWADLAGAAADFGVPQTKVLPYLIAMDQSGLAEQRAAKRLGIDLAELTRHSVNLWGVNLSEQRDRAEPGANVSRLGQITRELVAQIEARL